MFCQKLLHYLSSDEEKERSAYRYSTVYAEQFLMKRRGRKENEH